MSSALMIDSFLAAKIIIGILVSLFVGALGGVFLYIRKKRCFELVAHFESADARRRAHPPRANAHPSCTSPSDEFVHEHGFYRGLWWQIIKPVTSFDAVVVGVHGYADHSDFSMMYHAHELRRGANVAVVLFDQPGFGRSDGLWCHIKDWFIHAETCRSFIEHFVKTKFPEKRIFGLGFSMGGGILTTIEATRPCLDGMVLLAPMLRIRPEVKPHPQLHRVLLFMARLMPTWPVAINNHNGQISYRDLAYQTQVHELNKLQYPGFPRLGTAVQLLRAQQWLERNCARVSCPFLVLHGTADVVTCIEGSRQLFTRTAKSIDKQIIELDGYRHHLLGPGQDDIYNDKPYKLICEWIKSRT